MERKDPLWNLDILYPKPTNFLLSFIAGTYFEIRYPYKFYLTVLGEWTHIASTYDSTKEIAVIYVNGEIKEGANGAGALSEDWDGKAAFGRHEGTKKLYDYYDEIDMYDRELSPLEIRQMFMKCSDVIPYGNYMNIYIFK